MLVGYFSWTFFERASVLISYLFYCRLVYFGTEYYSGIDFFGPIKLL